MTRYLYQAHTYKHTILGGVLGLILLCMFALPAQAQTKSLSELEKMIQDLMAQIELLQKEVKVIETPRPTPPKVCTDWKHTLKIGSKDADTNGEVSSLQKYLTTTGDYTHGRVTGVFGPVTEAAVQKWQKSNGVVASGTPSSTGYGVFGKNTREKIRGVGCAPQAKSYVLTDVQSVTKKSVDPIPLAIDDEYTLYTVTLKTGVVHTFKQGFSAPGAFENQIKATGYTGDINALLTLATTITNSYGIDDVASVTLDSSKTLFDGPAEYTIKLKNRTQVVVSVCVSRGCTDANRDAAFKDSGYTGDVAKLIALSKKQRVCMDGRKTYQEGEKRTDIAGFAISRFVPNSSYVCRGGDWKVEKGTTASSTEGLAVQVVGRAATAKFSLTNGCQGYSLSWGDGTAEDKVPASTQLACTLAITEVTRVHTYAKAGRYTVTLTLLQNTGAPKIYSKNIVVMNPSSSSLFQSN